MSRLISAFLKKRYSTAKKITTGIGKRPVSGAVNLGKLGFEGDGVADTKNHGGIDKAVCVYSLDHYAYWEETLGINLPCRPFLRPGSAPFKS